MPRVRIGAGRAFAYLSSGRHVRPGASALAPDDAHTAAQVAAGELVVVDPDEHDDWTPPPSGGGGDSPVQAYTLADLPDAAEVEDGPYRINVSGAGAVVPDGWFNGVAVGPNQGVGVLHRLDLRMSISGDLRAVKFDGVAEAQNNNDLAGVTHGGEIRLGWRNGATTYNGRMYLALLYGGDTLLTPEERAEIRDYGTARFGVAA